MKKMLLWLFISSFTFASFAQKGKISGNIIDEKQAGLPFANVLVLKASDSTLAKAGVADVGGQFVIEDLAFGQYVVTATMVGYAKFTSPKVVLTAENPTVKLPNLAMMPAVGQLAEVRVSARKPLIEQQADKLVMNVEAAAVNAGSTALEVLRSAPGVSIDQNDAVSLKGKQGVQIYMDGKPTYMSQDQLTNMLKTMNADQIGKIEIIANPSAKYDAAGNAGIINIVTKRDKNLGTNGSVTLGGGLSLPPALDFGVIEGQLPKVSGNVNLNNRSKKVNTFANLSSRYGQNFNYNYFERKFDNRIIEQYGFRMNQSNNTSLRAGVDYFPNSKATVGFLVNASMGKWGSLGENINNSEIKNGEIVESAPKTTSRPIQTWKNLTLNSNYKYKFDEKGTELTADVDYSFYKNYTAERGMFTHFFNGQNIEVGQPLHITSDIPNNYNIAAIKADFSKPLSQKAKIETGIKLSKVQSDNDIKFYNEDVLDKGRTNHFLYNENVLAAYGNYALKASDKWNFQLGLRAENTHSKGESITLNEEKERKYLNFFPSVFITNTLNKNNSLNVNYSRRIDRPNYQSLNPFIFFLDPYTYELGNEKLIPEYSHSLELTHTFKGAFNTTFGYSNTQNYTTQVIKNAINQPEILEKLQKYNFSQEIDPTKITFATQENIGTKDNYSLSISAPIPVKKWWNMNVNITGYYQDIKGVIATENIHVKLPGFNYYTSQNFTLPKDWAAEASMWYNSPFTDGVFQGRAQYAVNAALSKKVLKGKGNFRINVNDMFLTSQFRGESALKAVNMKIYNRWDSRAVRANFTYRFGNQNVKASRNRQTATSAEQQRVGGNN